MDKDKKVELRVAAKSQIEKLGSAIARFVDEGKEVHLLAMGAGAVNQAVKSFVKARTFTASTGVDLLMKAGFIDVEVDGKKVSAVKFRIVVQ